MPEMPLGFDLSFVDVDQIAHGLEKVKGDARGQQDPQCKGMQGEPACVDQRVDLLDRGSAQLKNQQDGQKRQDTPRQAEPFFLSVRSLLQPQGQTEGEQGGKKEQQAVGHMQIHVKGIACKQQKDPPKSGRQDIIEKKHSRQKDGE